MTTSELITFLTTQTFTDEQAYSLLVDDIFDATSPGQVQVSQGTIRYFEYKIRGVLFPAIRQLRAGTSDAENVPATNRPENVSGASAPKDGSQVVQNDLNRVSGAEQGQ